MATSSVIKPTAAWRHLKWYEYVPNRDRLDLWVRSKAPGRITSLRFDLREETTGWFDPIRHSIGVNPTSVGKSPREQWVGTRAIALHEAGHALHTGNLGTGLLHHVSNLLEDQRIEWLMCNADPAMTKEMRFKNRWRWKETAIATAANDDPEHILEAALLYRWEWWLGIGTAKRKRKTIASVKTPVSKIVLGTENQKRWDTVRSWVESAWVAETSDQVVAYARRILEFLKIPETADLPHLFFLIAKTDGIATGTSEPLTGAPHAPTSHGSGGDGVTDHSADDGVPPGDEPDGGDAGADRSDLHGSINPNYVEYVDAVAPWVRQLTARLERPTPRARIIPNGARGRYSLRADLHDPDRPFLARTAPAIAPGLAVEILGDQSGSMGTATSPTEGSSKMNAARLGVMTLHLACEARRIPHAITLFDGFFSVLEYNGDAQIASALIAGWDGFTGQEHVSQHMRRRAPKLLARPEGTKLMIVVHDGYPVATGDPEDIVRFQKEYAGRIHVVGVYLCDERGGSSHEIAQMQSLFATLIVAKPSELSDKLGDLIAALA
jgi:hypothetical protein